jgi:hypothetical protein
LNVNMLCGVMDAFSKLTEDIPLLMIRETPQLLEVLVPKWIALFAHENSLVRHCAASCVNTFIPFDPAPLVLHVNQFLEVRGPCLCTSMRAGVCVCVCVYVCLSASMRMCVWVGVFVCFNVCVCVCVCSTHASAAAVRFW